jgi:hypothetical protein
MELIYGQPLGGFVVFTDGDALPHAGRFGSLGAFPADADDQQDAGHADDAFGGTSRNTCKAKSDRARGSLVPLPGQDGTAGQTLEEALDAIAGWVCGALSRIGR